MIYIVKINNKEYAVEVERGKATLLKTTEFALQPAAPATVKEPDVSAPATHSGGNTVTCPMPGTVIHVKAAPGKSVKTGEVLLVFEAMKMENEITAPADGVVEQVFVTKGSAVSIGDALVSIR